MFCLTIVIYKKTPDQSATLQSLAQLSPTMRGRMRLLLWDNSPEPYSEADLARLHALTDGVAACDYLHGAGQNRSLSWIYNESIRQLREDEYLVILDDDSEFEPAFFDAACQAIADHPEQDLFIPIVEYGQQIVSPGYTHLFRGGWFDRYEPGVKDCKHLFAINSGMIIAGRYLKNGFPGYDERIRFYCTDNDFMDRYGESHTQLVVFDYRMKHTLNYYERNEPFSRKKARFRDQRRGLRIRMKRRGVGVWLLSEGYFLLFSIKYAIQQRDVRYLFVF